VSISRQSPANKCIRFAINKSAIAAAASTMDTIDTGVQGKPGVAVEQNIRDGRESDANPVIGPSVGLSSYAGSCMTRHT
jgi:hypothetical protein